MRTNSQPKRRGHKMWYPNIYSKIHLYQKYLETSIQVGCVTHSLYASSDPKDEGVPTNNHRGRGSGPCSLQGQSYSPNRLVSQSAMLKEYSVQSYIRAKHKTYRPLDDLRVILPTSQAFDYFRARSDKIRFAFDPL